MKYVPLVFACLLAGQPGGAYGQAPCQAHLKLHQRPEGLIITGHCLSLMTTSARYRYQLVVKHRSSIGQSQNSQGGTFDLAGSQDIVLSSVRLSAGPNDSLVAQLLIFDELGHVIAQDSTQF